MKQMIQSKNVCNPLLEALPEWKISKEACRKLFGIISGHMWHLAIHEERYKYYECLLCYDRKVKENRGFLGHAAINMRWLSAGSWAAGTPSITNSQVKVYNWQKNRYFIH
jgi:hypothetical protein